MSSYLFGIGAEVEVEQCWSVLFLVAVEPIRHGEALVVGRPEVLSAVDVVGSDCDAEGGGRGEGGAAGGHLSLQRHRRVGQGSVSRDSCIAVK